MEKRWMLGASLLALAIIVTPVAASGSPPLHRQPSHHKVYNWWPVYQLEGCGTWKLHLCSLPHRDQRSGQLRLCQQRWKRCARSARCDSERGRSQDKHSTLERTDNVHRGNTRPASSERGIRMPTPQWFYAMVCPAHIPDVQWCHPTHPAVRR